MAAAGCVTPKQSSIVIPAFLAFFELMRILQEAPVCGPENARANSRSSHPWSTLPPPKEPPTIPTCAAAPAPLKQGTVGSTGGAIADAATFVLLLVLFDPLPPPVAFEAPPVADWF